MIAVSGRMQVDNYQDNEGKNRNYTYVLVEDLEYLERKKETNQEEVKKIENFSTTTKVQQQYDYTDEELPF